MGWVSGRDMIDLLLLCVYDLSLRCSAAAAALAALEEEMRQMLGQSRASGWMEREKDRANLLCIRRIK